MSSLQLYTQERLGWYRESYGVEEASSRAPSIHVPTKNPVGSAAQKYLRTLPGKTSLSSPPDPTATLSGPSLTPTPTPSIKSASSVPRFPSLIAKCLAASTNTLLLPFLNLPTAQATPYPATNPADIDSCAAVVLDGRDLVQLRPSPSTSGVATGDPLPSGDSLFGLHSSTPARAGKLQAVPVPSISVTGTPYGGNEPLVSLLSEPGILTSIVEDPTRPTSSIEAPAPQISIANLSGSPIAAAKSPTPPISVAKLSGSPVSTTQTQLPSASVTKSTISPVPTIKRPTPSASVPMPPASTVPEIRTSQYPISTAKPVASAAPSAQVLTPSISIVTVPESSSYTARDIAPQISIRKSPASDVKPRAPPVNAAKNPTSRSSAAKAPVPSASVSEPGSSTTTVRQPPPPISMAERIAQAPYIPESLIQPVTAGSSGQVEEDPFGLKILAGGSGPVVDLVAIHGLDGHWKDTWTAANGFFWLRDFLPERIPNARIMSWGYDGRTSGKQFSCQSLHDRALGLVTDLTTLRRVTNTEQRPIIFIAHSVGGIIVKDALIHSSAANKSNLEYHNAIKTSTCGVLYFGTPHQGTETTSWSEIVFNTTSALTRKNKALLRELEEHSGSLQKQLSQYTHISNHFDTKFFYETYPTAGSNIVVPPAAAVVPGEANAEVLVIYSDHAGLVKYKSPDDGGFKKVSLCLLLMVDDAPRKVSNNWELRRRVEAAEGNDGVQTTYEIPFELPYLRNHRFTGRESLLSSLHAKIQANSSGQSTPIIFHGTGGIGKSQIVVEYLYRHQNEYPSVFWIDAATPETIVLGFRAGAQRLIKQHAKICLNSQPHYPSIAKALGMVGVVDDNGSLPPGKSYNDAIIDGMKLWLSKKENQNWLLVFDNVDDLESIRIEEFMPTPASGTIIMTSRRPECTDLGIGLEVKEMSEEEGVTLLLKTARLNLDLQSSGELTPLAVTKVLGFLPLALVQAGAFVAARRISLKQYLEIYEESFDRAFAKKPLRGAWTYEERSILTTWEISFQAIKEVNSAAAELLSLCAFLSNEVQEDMLCRGGMIKTDVSLEESLEILYSYSLAHAQIAHGSFYIHPVVHRWAQERLDHIQRVEKTQEAVTLVISALKHSGQKTLQNWEYERTAIPHLDVITKNTQKYLYGTEEIIWVLTEVSALSRLNYEWGRTNEAESIAAQLKDLAEVVLGEDNLITTSMMGNLALMHSTQGRLSEAEKIGLHVLKTRESKLGTEHPDTLMVMVNLADTYHRQGRWDEAERLSLRAVEIMNRHPGPDHPETLLAMSNLAETYSKQGRWNEAEKLHRHILEVRQRDIGPEHPDTLRTMGSLAATFSNQGRRREAEKLNRHVLDGSNRALGPEHPDTLLALVDQANTYRHEGRLEEAEQLNLQILERVKRNLGPNHPDTMVPICNLASVYAQQERFGEAEMLYLEALNTNKTRLGPEHPETLSNMFNLSSIYISTNRWDEAEAMSLQVLDAAGRSLGPAHPGIVAYMERLVGLYMKQGKTAQGREMLLKLVPTSERILGKDHPQTAKAKFLLSVTPRHEELSPVETLSEEPLTIVIPGKDDPNRLAVMAQAAETYLLRGRPESAEGLLEEVMEERERTLGSEHPETLSTAARLASVYFSQKWWRKAEALQKQVLDTRYRVFGGVHSDTLSSMVDLASTYWSQGFWEEAEVLEQQVVDARHTTLGNNHPATLSAMASLAVTYRMQGQYREAEELHVKVVEGTKRIHGVDHLNTMAAMANLASTYDSMKRWEEAGTLQRQVVDTRQKHLGTGHPDTQRAVVDLQNTYKRCGKQDTKLNHLLQSVQPGKTTAPAPDTFDEIAALVETYIDDDQEERLPELLMETIERLGDEHKATIFLKGVVSRLFQDSGHYEEASLLREQMVGSLQRLGGSPAALLQLIQSI